MLDAIVNSINAAIGFVNAVLWSEWQVLIYLLIIAGVWFTFRLGALQLRQFGHMFSLMRGSGKADSSGISSFQALCTILVRTRWHWKSCWCWRWPFHWVAAGAVFWMWVIAILGIGKQALPKACWHRVYKVRGPT